MTYNVSQEDAENCLELFKTDRVSAIKFFRSVTGLSLKGAKVGLEQGLSDDVCKEFDIVINDGTLTVSAAVDKILRLTRELAKVYEQLEKQGVRL